MSVTGAIMAGVGAAGSIGGAVIGGNAAQSAAQTQAQAAQQANQIQQQEFNQEQSNLSKYMSSGNRALDFLNFDATNPAGQFHAPAPFTAPTAAQAAAMPGYQFALQQGEGALQNNMVARGISGGNAGEGIVNYAEGLADQNYGNLYNQALQAHQTNFNNSLTAYNTNLGQLQHLAGMGESAAGGANQAAENYANQTSQNLIGAGNAQAAGTVGAANAWNQGLGGATGSVLNGLLLNQMLNPNQSSLQAQTPAQSPGTGISAGQWANVLGSSGTAAQPYYGNPDQNGMNFAQYFG